MRCRPWHGHKKWVQGVPGPSGWLPGWDGAHAGLPLSVPAAWPRYRVMGSADAGQYNLEITDAELSDDASYECQATEAALRSRRAKLTVLSNSPQLPTVLSAHSSCLFLLASWQSLTFFSYLFHFILLPLCSWPRACLHCPSISLAFPPQLLLTSKAKSRLKKAKWRHGQPLARHVGWVRSGILFSGHSRTGCAFWT